MNSVYGGIAIMAVIAVVAALVLQTNFVQQSSNEFSSPNNTVRLD
ncbi:MAG: hypothetical protein AAGE61_17640 [Pseudomonadota bacterium]